MRTSLGALPLGNASIRRGVRASIMGLLHVLGGSLGAQVTDRRLANPLTLQSPFSQITAIRELSSGRAILLDGAEQALYLIDIEKGAKSSIGARGSGPGEFARALGLLPAAADTTYLTDQGNARLLVIAPSGTAVRTASDLRDFSLPPWRATNIDAAGRLYGAAYARRSESDLAAPPDSVSLLRIDLVLGSEEHLTELASAPARFKVTRNGNAIAAVDIIRPPYAVGDAFDVSGDGRVAIARVHPYRVDQILPNGTKVVGREVAVRSTPVGPAEKREYLDGLSKRVRPESLEWPTALPAFYAAGVRALPDGTTLVRRMAAAALPERWYDRFDREGKLCERVVLSRNQRIVAATNRFLWVARADTDGLEHLERFGAITGGKCYG